MDLILADANGAEERVILDPMDMDIGLTNDFQITVSYAAWTGDMTFNKFVYIPGTEYGGRIEAVEGATNVDQIKVKGYTWRGYLAKRVICPGIGADYYVVSGELNNIIRELLGGLFVVPQVSTGVSVTNFQFDRYCTLLDGLNKMLQSVGFCLDIKYVQGITSGHVEVQAAPAVTYGDVEFSQDVAIDFASSDNRMGVNHLVCLGTGELNDRVVLHLFADANGNISEQQTFFGLDEIVEVYENTSAELEELRDGGIEKLQSLVNKKTFTADVKDVQTADLNIGDIVTGRDYITGNVVTKPITEKVIKLKNGTIDIEYKIEGD